MLRERFAREPIVPNLLMVLGHLLSPLATGRALSAEGATPRVQHHTLRTPVTADPMFLKKKPCGHSFLGLNMF